jgi:hypothetical protein
MCHLMPLWSRSLPGGEGTHPLPWPLPRRAVEGNACGSGAAVDGGVSAWSAVNVLVSGMDP